MIIFHEGLPRSGKSYEAVVRRIIPALQSGRAVDAYVDGLNHQKLADLAGISVERCQELLRQITEDQAPRIAEHARDNALVVIDEAQNHWDNRARIDAPTKKFITEHGHRGIDLVLMGQDLRDVHAMWRRRVEVKMCFLKLTAVGKENSYSVTTFRHLGGDQWEKAGLEFRSYDPKYFGTYKSHVGDGINKANMRDARSELLKTPMFRYGIPAVLVLSVWAIFKLIGFFTPPEPVPVASAAPAPAPAPRPPVPVLPPMQQVNVEVQPQGTAEQMHLVELTRRYRIRLAGYISRPDRATGVVEWYEGGSRVAERMTLDALRQLGVSVVLGDAYVKLQSGPFEALATMWPLDVPRQTAALPAMTGNGAIEVERHGLRSPEPEGTITEEPPRAPQQVILRF